MAVVEFVVRLDLEWKNYGKGLMDREVTEADKTGAAEALVGMINRADEFGLMPSDGRGYIDYTVQGVKVAD